MSRALPPGALGTRSGTGDPFASLPMGKLKPQQLERDVLLAVAVQVPCP